MESLYAHNVHLFRPPVRPPAPVASIPRPSLRPSVRPSLSPSFPSPPYHSLEPSLHHITHSPPLVLDICVCKIDAQNSRSPCSQAIKKAKRAVRGWRPSGSSRHAAAPGQSACVVSWGALSRCATPGWRHGRPHSSHQPSSCQRHRASPGPICSS